MPLAPRVQATVLSDCHRVIETASGRDDFGFAKVLCLHPRWHPLVVDVIEAKRALFSFTSRPQDAILRHDQGVLEATGHFALTTPQACGPPPPVRVPA